MLEVIFLGISRGGRITTLGRVLTRTQVKRRGYKFGAILLKEGFFVKLQHFHSIIQPLHCNGSDTFLTKRAPNQIGAFLIARNFSWSIEYEIVCRTTFKFLGTFSKFCYIFKLWGLTPCKLIWIFWFRVWFLARIMLYFQYFEIWGWLLAK